MEQPNGQAVINPYARTPAGAPMGPQSQRRLTLNERTHQLQADSNKRRAGQLTLFGGLAFDPEKNCVVCKARLAGRTSHKGHYQLCPNNRRTKGKSPATMEQAKMDKALQQHFETPLRPEEKASSWHITPESTQAFLARRNFLTAQPQQQLTTTTTTTITEMSSDSDLTGQQFCSQVTKILSNSFFQKQHERSRAPLAMLAFASVVVEKVVRKKQSSCFDGLTLVVSACKEMHSSPQCHSIAGQELLLVDWERMHGLQVKCPGCKGAQLVKDRTNFSKNKVLFPTFHLNGPPSWCMIMMLSCPRCHCRCGSNDGEILVQLPACAAATYPVETKYALQNKSCHLSKSATDVFDMLMTTYGNGDLCSHLLYNAINKAYLERVSDYYSFLSEEKNSNCPQPHIKKNGEYVNAFPPLGDSIHDTHDQATTNSNTPWFVSDHDRHTREIQGVKCSRLYAEDHTHEVTKNYFRRKQIGAIALWDVATETGEIATAVLVPSTKTKDLSHAAISLSKRNNFNPKAMCSDRWPTKIEYWRQVFHGLEGRLGLFHFLQRIAKTLRKRHIDYFMAINQLLNAVYIYNQDDYESLLITLKDGTLMGRKHSDQDIADLKATKYFRQRCAKYLRKEIWHPNVMCDNLDQWFARFKCTASEGSSPALGRFDPVTGDSLFTPETKTAIANCKEKSMYLQDPLPLDQMYDVTLPNPNSPHGLKEHLSRRGESNLESFHLMLAHFGNTGMRETLADNLNLTGTARYNLQIRHKMRISRLTDENTRALTPAGWETIPDHFNHSELDYVNKLARSAGITQEPFPNLETLQPDNGEKFFSRYLSWLQETRPSISNTDMCLCSMCSVPTPQIQTQTNVITQTNAVEKTVANEPTNVTDATTTTQPTPQTPAATAPNVQNDVTRNGAHQSSNWFTAPTQPLWLNLYFVPWPNWNHCCQKYKECCFRLDRRGRPPHDNGCHFEAKTSTV